MDTVGIVVIGNEVLSGKVEEENARFLIGALREIGVPLRRVVFVRDDLDEIADEVRAMAERFTHVFTTGGVGGTHDDITVPAVAQAFGVEVVAHPDLQRLLEQDFGSDIPEALRRMAFVPDGAELLYGEGSRIPALKMRNVFVLPGAPRFLKDKFPAIRPLLTGTEVWLGEVFLGVHEEHVAEILERADGLEAEVEVGSYPRFDAGADHRVKVTIEGPSEAAAVRVFQFLMAGLADPSMVVRSVTPRQVGGPRPNEG